MTKEEIKEAIASTIVENGQKGITATALANLLNEIVDAAGSGGGSIVDDIFIDLGDVDEDGNYSPNEQRAEIYTRIAGSINNGVFPDVKLGGFDTTGAMAYYITGLTYDKENNIIVFSISIGVQFALYSNGSMLLIFE